MYTKVVERTEQDLQGYMMPDGKKLYAHKITVEGVVYNYDSKSQELTAFEAGKEATFTTEQKTQSNGKVRLKIKPVSEPPARGGFTPGGSKYRGEDKDQAQISILSCISSAATYAQSSSKPWSEVLKNAEEAYQIVKSKKGDFK